MNRRLRRLRVRRSQSIGDHQQILGAFSPSSPDEDWSTFDAHLSQLETSVEILRQRFEQMRAAQEQQREIEQQLQNSDLKADEIQQLKQRLEELEMQFESQLFDWGSLREPFWQAVRFGGLGIILGWILRGIASR
ncbi:DUF2203 domain-containing protein [Oscillatoria sp. CS-180]|uniref:DUF2203 domain-containing protein n=1 Tax=Oscillatoria sp. CS-180 TaxID=3021720 RepID=UPI00232B0442|nr:DUF2203 domain-containing protein [Oscillatoria sp. CS-180]MDB9529877.1 DUF2203 domain-containing protein [Oscillatoria sp. CS-180]